MSPSAFPRSTRTADRRHPDRVHIAWHRPLLAVAAVMTLLALISIIGLFVDHREVTGLPLWAKPLKFALSIIIYSVTLAWLIGLLRRGQRLAWSLGTLSAVLLLVEMVAIVAAALGGTTSHFNVSSPFAAAVWSIMAGSIVMVWCAALVVGVLLLFWGRSGGADLGDRARTLAICAGVILAVIGMGLAFFMTGPTAAQLEYFQGIAGAHTVGGADGGPGLPILGWSTVAGDLRIPHFIGMHALQLIPLGALLLEVLMNRMPALRPERTRVAIIGIVTGLYSGVLILLTVQALNGESVVRPSALTVTLASLLYFIGATAIALIVWTGRRQQQRRRRSRLGSLTTP